MENTETPESDSPYLNDLTSVVLPAHNEADGIADAVSVVGAILDECGPEWEILVVDDGSVDSTYEIVRRISTEDPRVRCVRLSRNFGKESALLAGLKYANGQRVITLDADLQHPPTLIPDMIREWRRGALIVNGVKKDRESDTRIARFRAGVFNALVSGLGGIQLHDSSDFKLLDRKVVNALTEELRERERFYRGLTDWLGFESVDLPFVVNERAEGTGKWSVWKLVELALTALVSFTSAPLRIVTVLGVMTLFLGAVIGLEAVFSWVRGEAVSGFATIIITLLLIGSFVMISLGIIGEYIAKIYAEVKSRPAYMVSEETQHRDANN